MSYDLTIIALQQKNISSSEKHVLTLLAFRANDEAKTWPSAKTITKETNLDKKTVYQCLIKLEEKNLIKKTGELQGRTKSIPVYKLNLSIPENGLAQKPSVPVFTRSVPENGQAKHTRKRYIEYKDKNINKNAISSNPKPKKNLELSREDFELVQDYKNDLKHPKMASKILDPNKINRAIYLMKRENIV